MHSYDIVGYIHSDGYALCEKHADYGDMPDDNNEFGTVQPIFADSEWDTTPTCDVCGEELDVTLIEQEDNTMEFSAEVQQELESIYVFQHDGNDYCAECFAKIVLADEQDVNQAMLDACNMTGKATGLITDNTFQFEQYAGQVIPLDGIYCSACKAELYAPIEGE